MYFILNIYKYYLSMEIYEMFCFLNIFLYYIFFIQFKLK